MAYQTTAGNLGLNPGTNKTYASIFRLDSNVSAAAAPGLNTTAITENIGTELESVLPFFIAIVFIAAGIGVLIQYVKKNQL